MKTKKVKKVCLFCGTTKNMTKHHIIFKEFLAGEVLENNTEDICKKCHDKFHALVKPMIDTLLTVVKQIQPKKVRKIGFRRTNNIKKKVKENLDQTYNDGKSL